MDGVNRAVALLILTACSYNPRSATTGDGVTPEDSSTPPTDTAPVTPDWALRRLLTINNATIGAATNFPLHAKLDASRISYAQAQPTGADLRFEDTAGTPLAYEIERWNPAGTSTIWVRR